MCNILDQKRRSRPGDGKKYILEQYQHHFHQAFFASDPTV